MEWERASPRSQRRAEQGWIRGRMVAWKRASRVDKRAHGGVEKGLKGAHGGVGKGLTEEPGEGRSKGG